MRRDDKNQRTYFRSQRIFCTNGQWYFATREGEHGPFGSRARAEAALARFVNDKVELDGFQQSRRKTVAQQQARAEQPARTTHLELVGDVVKVRRKALIY
jgi:hypothetical protein